MEDKTKLYVFARKEVALIFLFMILMAATSFVLGLKIGKNFSFNRSGFTTEDVEKVELLSGQEESVRKVVNEDSIIDEETKSQKEYERLKAKIDQEFKDEESGQKNTKSVAPTETSVKEVKVETDRNPPVPEEPAHNPTGSADQFTGKYTVQLGSHRSVEEAEKFADGFRVRGYNPIINEVKIDGRGVWYRVSLGVFDNISDAKDYIEKEKTLFQGQDYVIGKFQ